MCLLDILFLCVYLFVIQKKQFTSQSHKRLYSVQQKRCDCTQNHIFHKNIIILFVLILRYRFFVFIVRNFHIVVKILHFYCQIVVVSKIDIILYCDAHFWHKKTIMVYVWSAVTTLSVPVQINKIFSILCEVFEILYVFSMVLYCVLWYLIQNNWFTLKSDIAE